MFAFESRLQGLTVPISQHGVNDSDIDRRFADAIHRASYRRAGRDDFGTSPHQQRRVIVRLQRSGGAYRREYGAAW
jgi:hypothetical protein